MTNEEFFEKIKSLVEDLKKSVENDKLQYTAQISDSSSQDSVKYCVSIHGFSDLLTPASFIEDTPEKVVEKIQKFIDTKDKDWADIQFYKAQTYACLESAKKYRNLIQEIKDRKNKETDEEKE